MTTKLKKSRSSNDQFKLKILCDLLCDNIEELLNYFGLEYKANEKMISMSCPIHGGDNQSAISLYYTGDSYRGNWKCRTHNCEKVFQGSIIGFIRGVISNQKYNWVTEGDQYCSFKEALDFATKFVQKDLNSIKVSNIDRNKKTFTSLMNYIDTNDKNEENKVSRKVIQKSLTIPSTYFIDRNYAANTLEKYDVGLCDNPKKPMYNRAVVPIYDNNYQYMIGCTGRSIFESCKICGAYHNPSSFCPEENDRWKYSKWKHSTDFKSQNSLYNFWFAKEHILASTIAIIVESPGNVWRLEENGIHNSLAIFGSSLSDRQKILLDSSGAMNLVILTDNDEAGRKAAEQIKTKCQNTYKVYIPSFSASDIGEMSSEQIDNEIKPFLENII